jgi:hypothetical protein
MRVVAMNAEYTSVSVQALVTVHVCTRLLRMMRNDVNDAMPLSENAK